MDNLLKLIPNYDPFVNSNGYHFDSERALKAIQFIEKCCIHTKGPLGGQPFLLLPWQRSIVANAFGWVDQDGYRRYRNVYIEVPKKSGKSQLGAALALKLFSEPEPGCEVYSIAAAAHQARNVFGVAQQIIHRSINRILPPTKRWKVMQNAITRDNDSCTYRCISAETGTHDGYNPFGYVLDELHRQDSRELYDLFQASTAARKEPLQISLTTAGCDFNSICWEVHQYAKDIQSGKAVDPSFLPVVYAAKHDDDWTSPDVWKKANPSIGVSVSEDFIAAECKKAQSVPAYQNSFLRYHLNIWTEQADRWLSMLDWDMCQEEFDESKLLNSPAYGGLDLGLTEDLSAFVLYFPQYKVCKCWVWMPQDGIANKETQDRAEYRTWQRQGFLEFTKGNATDYDVIEKRILDITKKYKVKKIAVDRAYALPICNHLIAHRLPLESFGQGYLSMTSPTKELERMVLSKELNHLGNPLLRYAAANAALKQDENAATDSCKIIKSHSYSRIDPLVALIMALGVSLSQPTKKSVYASKGLLMV